MDTSRKIRMGVLGGGFGTYFPWHLDLNATLEGSGEMKVPSFDR